MEAKKLHNQKKNRCVLFDMDGVVLDSMPYHVRAWKDAFKEHGMEVDEKLFYLYEGAIEPDVACTLFSKNGAAITTDEFFEIHSMQKRYFMERYAEKVRPFRDVPKLLEKLKESKVKTALVTSSHKDILEAVLPKPLKALFDHVVTGDEVKKRKPHPDPYLAGLSGIGANRANGAIAVENAPAGIESAKRAGLSCIAITTTLSKKHLCNADLVIDNHGELINLL